MWFDKFLLLHANFSEILVDMDQWMPSIAVTHGGMFRIWYERQRSWLQSIACMLDSIQTHASFSIWYSILFWEVPLKIFQNQHFVEFFWWRWLIPGYQLLPCFGRSDLLSPVWSSSDAWQWQVLKDFMESDFLRSRNGSKWPGGTIIWYEAGQNSAILFGYCDAVASTIRGRIKVVGIHSFVSFAKLCVEAVSCRSVQSRETASIAEKIQHFRSSASYMLDLVQDFSKNFCSFFAGTRCEIFGILSLIFVYICWVFCKVEHCKHCWLMDTAGWFQTPMHRNL